MVSDFVFVLPVGANPQTRYADSGTGTKFCRTFVTVSSLRMGKSP